MINGLIIFAEALLAFFMGTILFDLVHYGFHYCLTAKFKFLQRIGYLHSSHHRFFPASLTIQNKWIRANLLQHIGCEYFFQVLGSLLCLFFLSSIAIGLAIGFETLIFLCVYVCRGVDLHHRPYQNNLPSFRGGPWVSADYHALHHIYPNNFFSSYLKIVDYIFGTGCQLAGKRIAMTGASGALGSHMHKLLEKEGAIVTTFKFGKDYTYDCYDQFIPVLKESDILFLCHGSKFDFAQQANCDSFISLIELFKRVRPRQFVPAEVWAVGSEIECHPCFGIKKIQVYAKSKRNYAKAARVYFHDRNIQYRHIVHSAFMSPMGPGLMSAKFAAKITLFMLKRGFKYIPVSYMGFAYLNYFRFVFN